jgi:AcrR family transcriptional regulator
MSIEAAAADGRMQRSQRSRDRIVAGMIACIRAGDPSPSAADVAEAAGVGLRTVFRQFEDMDALYIAISARTEAEVAPILAASFVSADWHGRVAEMLVRRARVFEHIRPLKVAAALRRRQSRVLEDDAARFLARERATLEAVLPPDALADRDLTEAIALAASFEAWRRLREDQNLDPETAERITCRLVACLLAGL